MHIWEHNFRMVSNKLSRSKPTTTKGQLINSTDWGHVRCGQSLMAIWQAMACGESARTQNLKNPHTACVRRREYSGVNCAFRKLGQLKFSLSLCRLLTAKLTRPKSPPNQFNLPLVDWLDRLFGTLTVNCLEHRNANVIITWTHNLGGAREGDNPPPTEWCGGSWNTERIDVPTYTGPAVGWIYNLLGECFIVSDLISCWVRLSRWEVELRRGILFLSL